MKKLLFFLIAVSLLAFVLPVNAQLMDSPWATNHHDIKNTGQSPHASTSNGTVNWIFTMGSDSYSISSQTIDNNGIIYFGSVDKNIYAVYSNGTKKWNYTTGDTIYYVTPAIDSNGIIYAGNDAGFFYALNPDGSLKWTFDAGGPIEASANIDSNGIIYFGDTNGVFHALYPDGTEKWNYVTNTALKAIFTTPAINNNIIYIGGINNNNKYTMFALYADGSLKWNYEMGTAATSYFSSPAIGSDGTIYTGINNADGGNGKLYALNPDGTLKWSYDTGLAYVTVSSPAIDNNGIIYYGSYDGYLYAINPSGTLKWKYNTGDYIYSSPAIDNNRVIYFSNKSGFIMALNPDGTLKWSHNMGQDTYASPSIGSDGIIYIKNTNGAKLYAFESKSPDIVCPVGWCYLTGIANKTLLELDAAVSDDTIQGRYNSTSKQYQNHRTGYSFNENVIVSPKEGYYYYFTAPKTITPTPGSTPSIILKQGWSLVGNYGSSARTLAELKLSIGATATKVSYYDKTLKKWIDADNRAVPAMESFMAYVITDTVWIN